MSAVDILDSFNEEYKPEAGGIDPGIDSLANGFYDFTVVSSEIKQARNGDTLLSLRLNVANAGRIQYDYWFTHQGNINRLGADLMTMGFDTRDLMGLRSVINQIEMGNDVLSGHSFRGHKDSYIPRDKTERTHILRVLSALSPGKANQALPPPQTQAPRHEPPRQEYESPSDDIPF